MSKIGKLPVSLPKEVKVLIEKKTVKVVGPKGELELSLPREIELAQEKEEVMVKVKSKSKNSKALHGTVRAHLSNMVKGVTEGWSKELEMVGTGYRSEVSGNELVLTVGFSHPVKMKIPEGLTIKSEKTSIMVEGADKELVGEMAAKIRGIRPPEPYKGKGVKYKDEVVRRKPGKAAKGPGAAA